MVTRDSRGRNGMVLDLQLVMQSVPITTNVVNLNPTHDEVYSIQYNVIKFVSDLCMAGRWFSPGTQFPPPVKLTATI